MEKTSEEILSRIGDDIWQYAELDAEQVSFSEQVVKACEANFCGKYGKCWTCPPHVGTLEALKKKYSAYRKVFVFTTKHEIEDSYDLDGMTRGQIAHNKVEEKLANGGLGQVEILGVGGCGVCETCAYPAPCRFPEKAKTSLEGCGIDVVTLAKTAKIKYTNGVNTVTYFTAVFFGER